MEQQSNSGLAELDVMRSVAEALGSLDDAAKKRVLKWTMDRFEVRGLSEGSAAGGHGTRPAGGEHLAAGAETQSFSDLPTFYAAANPATQSEKALVVGYWFQVVQGQADLDSQQINTQLKNLGHGAANITRALEDLISTRPQLVIQTRKSGTTKQARKKYRLTNEGIAQVRRMVAHPNGSKAQPEQPL
jgi:hypothetical protein